MRGCEGRMPDAPCYSGFPGHDQVRLLQHAPRKGGWKLLPPTTMHSPLVYFCNCTGKFGRNHFQSSAAKSQPSQTATLIRPTSGSAAFPSYRSHPGEWSQNTSRSCHASAEQTVTHLTHSASVLSRDQGLKRPPARPVCPLHVSPPLLTITSIPPGNKRIQEELPLPGSSQCVTHGQSVTSKPTERRGQLGCDLHPSGPQSIATVKTWAKDSLPFNAREPPLTVCRFDGVEQLYNGWWMQETPADRIVLPYAVVRISSVVPRRGGGGPAPPPPRWLQWLTDQRLLTEVRGKRAHAVMRALACTILCKCGDVDA
eukprot:353586-Chlamydomonas_euryale.AAC.2